MFSKFIHLHAHSEYSIDVGYCSIQDYILYCYKQHSKSACITERFNLFSSLKFYKECLKFKIKPIIGCELFIETDDNFSKVILLCQNFDGYKNLTRILSQSYLNMIDGIPLVKKEWLPFLSANLIAIGLSFESDISKYLITNQIEKAQKSLKFWQTCFADRYYLSVTNFNLPVEKIFLKKLTNFLKNKKINLVFTNEVCFLKKDDFKAYKIKLKTFDSTQKYSTEKQELYFKNKYFMTYNELYKKFYTNINLLYNSFEISKRCNLVLKFAKDYGPKYLKNENESNAKYLTKTAFEILFNKLNNLERKHWKNYIIRLKKELNTINSVGFSDYFLITSDFTIWAKNNNIAAGPGRGSGSGSLVAHLLEITNIDPIKFNLLFERFLNIKRISKPDFDIDFCIEGRDLIIDYIFKLYGPKCVAQIVTFGLTAVKAAIRDVGRVLGYSFFFINKLVKAISNNFGISLKSELIENEKLILEYNKSYDVQLILNTALKIEGMVKNISKHAGGLVISNINFLGILPVFMETDEYRFITNFDKNDAESIGFSKFDFLGLRTLSIINTTEELLDSYSNIFNYSNFKTEDTAKINDEKTFNLLQRADTLGIFQLDSVGIKSILQKIRPEFFFDIVTLIALYRPGPLQSGMLLSFIKRKTGVEKINYIHRILKLILGETYGMLVYQEQVMLIAQLFAGYDIGFADFLRIAISKKKKYDIIQHLHAFKLGASINKISVDTAIEVFNLIEKFGGYGFNKAHSVGYGYLTYNSAWLKSHYNIFFLCALISSDIENYDNNDICVHEIRYFQTKVLNPDINRSFYPFTIIKKNSMRYGLGGVKGIGKSIISEIINNRSIYGHFKSFFDFLYKIDVELLSKRVLQSLIYSGCFNKINTLKFKLVLITVKIINMYLEIKNTFKSETDFLDHYFNHVTKKFKYIINYKQAEIKETFNLLAYNITLINSYLNFYNYERSQINKLSFKSGKYINEIVAGIINNITINKNKVIISFYTHTNKKINITYSYNKYKDYEHLFKKYNLVVLGYYHTKDKQTEELFIENYYTFRHKFLKYIDIIFLDTFISNKFLQIFYKNILHFSKGCSIIRFKIPYKGKYIKIQTKYEINILLHDNIINKLLQFKEIKGLKYTYIF